MSGDGNNIGYLSETQFKLNYREISSVYNLLISQLPGQFTILHGEVLPFSVQNFESIG